MKNGSDPTTERNRDFQSRLQPAALALDISLTRSRLKTAVPFFFHLADRPNPVYTKLMAATYNMKEAQASLTKLCRSGERFVIANRNEPVVVALPVDDFEALMETLDVLGNPAAMEAIHAAKLGKTTYRPLDLDDENFGL